MYKKVRKVFEIVAIGIISFIFIFVAIFAIRMAYLKNKYIAKRLDYEIMKSNDDFAEYNIEGTNVYIFHPKHWEVGEGTILGRTEPIGYYYIKGIFNYSDTDSEHNYLKDVPQYRRVIDHMDSWFIEKDVVMHLDGLKSEEIFNFKEEIDGYEVYTQYERASLLKDENEEEEKIWYEIHLDEETVLEFAYVLPHEDGYKKDELFGILSRGVYIK